jgi:nicotinate-nucleotide adenylyltransferase
MCRLAAQGLDWVEVWDFELTRSGPSYTVETVEAYRRLWPGSRPVLILGWDTARELPSWERPQAILELADVAVVPRPGLPAPSLGELVGAGLAGTTVVCPGYTAPVQSTQIREAVRAGDSLAELVPTTVAAYIFANKLYL